MDQAAVKTHDFLPPAMVWLGLGVLGSVSCDKIKVAAAQLKKATESSSAEPKVNGTYSREQMKDIGAASYRCGLPRLLLKTHS